MLSADFFNIACCAEQRMNLLWEEACAANHGWEPFHNRRWREHETYMAMNGRALAIWKRGIDAMNQYDRDCY